MRVASYLKSTVSQRRHRRRKAVADFKQKQSHERPFADRFDAGRQLATKLLAYATCPNLLVLALPRGGVPVAYEVARALHAPLDIFIVRKLGVPWNEELAMGAIATGGVRVLNPAAISCSDLPESIIDEVAKREQKELERREDVYRGDRPAFDVHGRTVILVDDGLATGEYRYAEGNFDRLMELALTVRRYFCLVAGALELVLEVVSVFASR